MNISEVAVNNTIINTSKETIKQQEEVEDINTIPEIEFTDQPFPSVMETVISDTKSLCITLNTVFSPIFPQYRIPKIEYTPGINGGMILSTTISFDDSYVNKEYNGIDSFKAIELIADASSVSSNDTMSKFDVINNEANRNRIQKNANGVKPLCTYKFTKEAEAILKKFVPDNCLKVAGKNKKGNTIYKVDWKHAAGEANIETRDGIIPSVLVTIDLKKFVSEIYGRFAPDGSKYDYAVLVGNPIMSANSVNNIVPDYAQSLFIIRGNRRNIELFCNSYGVGSRIISGR